MRKSSTRAVVVIGGTLAGVSSTFAFGAQAALFPDEQVNSALDNLVAEPTQSAPVNSGSSTPTPSETKKAVKKNKQDSTPTPKATKTTKKPKNKNNGGSGSTSTPTANETTQPAGGPADGTFNGSNAKALNFGYVQVQVTVSGGQLTDIQFLSYPQRDNKSVDLSNRALPQLRQEALNSQSANVSNVSGASWTTRAFKASLNAALTAAGL
jgi:uncharacterized protein with FMN-binding domain